MFTTNTALYLRVIFFTFQTASAPITAKEKEVKLLFSSVEENCCFGTAIMVGRDIAYSHAAFQYSHPPKIISPKLSQGGI